MDSYNNNTTETKTAVELRERKQNYMRQYEREVEPCTKLSEKVMIPIKKYPKVFIIWWLSWFREPWKSYGHVILQNYQAGNATRGYIHPV